MTREETAEIDRQAAECDAILVRRRERRRDVDNGTHRTDWRPSRQPTSTDVEKRAVAAMLAERKQQQISQDAYAADWTRFVNQVIDQRLGNTSQLATREGTVRLIEEVCDEIASITGPMERMIRTGGADTAVNTLREEVLSRLDSIDSRLDAIEARLDEIETDAIDRSAGKVTRLRK
ncbi:hypothetical protein [Bradyrhizobium sp. WYCCWR 12699]|uniref:hypothetical protein n=1 Tax=Bradyrhizobium sp. WYCCWR 12699 TaxID=3064203 RepID=UPI0028A3CC07|nr:hypothetical protein [Bradyrhizobium sp. WYCCWR 12699]MDT4739252.1 hypothetical protein [Bradyrhizobium sp. WYCCWR 12699]